jgi:hypothetical protein
LLLEVAFDFFDCVYCFHCILSSCRIAVIVTSSRIANR